MIFNCSSLATRSIRNCTSSMLSLIFKTTMSSGEGSGEFGSALMIVAASSDLAGGVVTAGDVGDPGFGAGGATALDEAVLDRTSDEVVFVGGLVVGGFFVGGLAVGGLAVGGLSVGALVVFGAVAVGLGLGLITITVFVGFVVPG